MSIQPSCMEQSPVGTVDETLLGVKGVQMAQTLAGAERYV